MKKQIFSLIMVILSMPVFSQIELGDCDQPRNDKVQKQIDKALVSINKKTANDYRMARIYLNNALDVEPNNAHALYLMGELAIKEKNILKAEAYFTKVINACPNYLAEVQFYLGVIYLENGKKEKSAEMLELFLNNPERDRGFDKEANSLLKEMRVNKDLMANPVPFDPKPVNDVCTKDDEYLAIISPDQELCFFTRRSKKVDKYAGPSGSKRVVEEFSLATSNGGNYTKGFAMDYPFNQSFNEGGPTITANNKELYFTVCRVDAKGYENCDIYYTKKEMGYWGEINNLGEHINRPDSWESQPCVSADGQVLYFTSNRKGGYGGLDLYVCTRLPDGSWTEPMNVGEEVNTRKNEKSPFIHSDNSTLYFASNGHPTLGGYDINYSRKDLETGLFSEPLNIGYPINTSADEIALFVSLNGKQAYFSSNKLKGPGGWDFYTFDLYELARPEKVALVKGTLLDENNEVVRDAELQVKNLKTKEVKNISVDSETGEYAAVIHIKEQENLILKVNKEGAAFTSKFVDAEDETSNGVVNATLEVSPVKVGKEYRLNDINFSTDSYELSDNAKYVIEEFMLYLEDNPRVKIDIQGHTDNAGNPEANLLLSKNRSKVVYNYLVSMGISSSRMTYHGFGETKPLQSNFTEEGMAKNRRTVFVITAK